MFKLPEWCLYMKELWWTGVVVQGVAAPHPMSDGIGSSPLWPPLHMIGAMIDNEWWFLQKLFIQPISTKKKHSIISKKEHFIHRYCKSKTQAAISYIYTQGWKILYKNKDIWKYGFWYEKWPYI